jgi:hypothetical protein
MHESSSSPEAPLTSNKNNIFHYQKVDVHFAIDAKNKGHLVYAIKDHDLIMAMLKNNDICCSYSLPERLNDVYCQLELSLIRPESIKNALSDFESRTKIEQKEINGQTLYCRLTKAYNDMAANGEIKSIGRVLSQKEVELLNFIYVKNPTNHFASEI